MLSIIVSITAELCRSLHLALAGKHCKLVDEVSEV